MRETRERLWENIIFCIESENVIKALTVKLQAKVRSWLRRQRCVLIYTGSQVAFNSDSHSLHARRLHARLIVVISCCCWAHGDCPSPQKQRERKKAAGLPETAEAARDNVLNWQPIYNLPFGRSNATLPYEGTSTRSTCSKQNAIRDQLQRTPTPTPRSDCFSDRRSHVQEGGGSINCSRQLNNLLEIVIYCQGPRGQVRTGNWRICEARQL